MYREVLNFYKERKILITGHTGFKGTWLTKILLLAGAKVFGYSLEPPTTPSLFEISGMDDQIEFVVGDIIDYEHLKKVIDTFKPEIIIHLAAQPIVRTSYIEPRMTYETNVMGTVNVCECVRQGDYVKSFLNVTTDKVYKNKEWYWGYRENEELDGFDPYSNSKSCSELVTHSYINSFFNKTGLAVSTARAGNVIGGGDFSENRIIPDCVRAVMKGTPVIIRNPNSVRPYQHVIEPLFAYLMIASEQYKDRSKAGYYNVGPDDGNCVTTSYLVEEFRKCYGTGFKYENSQSDFGLLHEANFLKLDNSLIKKMIGWKPIWSINKAIEKTVELYSNSNFALEKVL